MFLKCPAGHPLYSLLNNEFYGEMATFSPDLQWLICSTALLEVFPFWRTSWGEGRREATQRETWHLPLVLWVVGHDSFRVCLSSLGAGSSPWCSSPCYSNLPSLSGIHPQFWDIRMCLEMLLVARICIGNVIPVLLLDIPENLEGMSRITTLDSTVIALQNSMYVTPILQVRFTSRARVVVSVLCVCVWNLFDF